MSHVQRNQIRGSATLVAVAVMAGALAAPAWATPDDATSPPAAGPFRKLAPGVENIVWVEKAHDETFSEHDVPELLSQDNTLDIARRVRFEHDVWTLEFGFKPVRMLRLSVPTGAGAAAEKLVWYMVYRVKNVDDKPHRFVPRFELVTDSGKSYLDTVLPEAAAAVGQREDPRRRFLTTVEMAGPIEPSAEGEDDGTWGVATWVDVDPGTDQFAVFVGGLSNAYRWQDLDDGGRQFERKQLQINFWRPGDDRFEHEEEIRLGVPGDVDYRWIYR